MCNFCAEDTVVHHQNFELGKVVNNESLEVLLVLAPMAIGSLMKQIGKYIAFIDINGTA